MTEIAPLFASQARLREAFIVGIEQMLGHHRGLGVFILALANATYDEALWQRLREPLKVRFEELADSLREELRAGRNPADAPDDVLVFLKLMAVGFDGLQLTRFRREHAFELQFNQLRAFRPSRMANVAVEELYRPFDPQGFHFNKPFLLKEVLWEGRLVGHDCRVLYNKFPFAELHALLVIGPEDNKPQWLTEADHAAAWQITSALAEGLPGVGFGYNAYGAYASVNHQHLQMFSRSDGAYPVEAPHWRHNGGEEDYPAECYRFENPDDAWSAIHAFHQSNRAYNLLYRPGRLYLLLRRFQGSYQHEPWTSGFAWSELAGAVTTFNPQDFETLGRAQIAAELEKLRY